jgi:hypothetical protein
MRADRRSMPLRGRSALRTANTALRSPVGERTTVPLARAALAHRHLGRALQIFLREGVEVSAARAVTQGPRSTDGLRTGNNRWSCRTLMAGSAP